jgi:hypothetical protein
MMLSFPRSKQDVWRHASVLFAANGGRNDGTFIPSTCFFAPSYEYYSYYGTSHLKKKKDQP